MSDTLYLIDASGYIYRAYHALPPLTTRQGVPTGAVYGYAHLLLRFLEEKKPKYIAAAFDASRETFRTEEFAAYKAHRPAMPDDLVPQVEPIREVTKAYQIPMLITAGVEADDLIASATKFAVEQGLNVVILSGDKDLMQLINDKVSLYDPIRHKHYGHAEVVEKFGVEPKSITDLLGLMGDSSDNLPGVPGIGEKTAAELLKTYGTLENVLASVDKINGPKRREALVKHADDARLSKRLATLREGVEVPKTLDAYLFKGIDMGQVKPLFARLEFSRLIVQASTQMTKTAIDKTKYKTIITPAELEELENSIRQSKEVSISLCLTEQDLQRAALVGVALCYAPGEACYIPLLHRYLGAPKQLEIDRLRGFFQSLFGSAPHQEQPEPPPTIKASSSGQIGFSFTPKAGNGEQGTGGRNGVPPTGRNGPEAENPNTKDTEVRNSGKKTENVAEIKVYSHNIKEANIIFVRNNLSLGEVAFDTMLASYLLSSDDVHEFSIVSHKYLGHEVRSLEELLGKGKKQLAFDELELPKAAEYAAERADVILRLAKVLPEKLEEAGMLELLQKVEHPIATLLAKIESAGVAIEVDYLRKMSQKLGEDLTALEKKCHDIAGIAFNVNSPKQLQEILFERLKLPIIKKTKTGPSTDSSVLEELDHPLTKAILELRHLSKLKGTYLDTLPEQLNPRTKRLHTSFRQDVAATGRLSSASPNLQNIPIRTEIGKSIRKAFIADPGNLIVAADFNQIELRLLAHFSGDPVFVKAFQTGEDIHRRTAAELIGKPFQDVTADERRLSKTITFGLIYGMGAFRLKQEINTSQSEAQAYIDKYFQRYARIKSFFEEVLEKARQSGEVRTILNRRRTFSDLNNANRQIRANAERMATNSGIQGSAADIMKVAMLRVDQAMQEANLKARIVLQVHDELVFEAPESEVITLKALAKTQMESMTKEFSLRVPLLADVNTAANWADAH